MVLENSVILSGAKDLLLARTRYTAGVREHLYYVYIVASRSRTLYIGVTSHIEGRVNQHRDGTFQGFTSRYRCDRLVWFLRFPYIEDAIAYEKKIKGWTRARKIALIEAENPTWEDLSADWGKPVALFDWSAEAKRKQILRSAQDDTVKAQDDTVKAQDDTGKK